MLKNLHLIMCRFAYAIHGLDLKYGLRKGRSDQESIDVATCARAHKALCK